MKLEERRLLLTAYIIAEVDAIPVAQFAKIIGVARQTVLNRYMKRCIKEDGKEWMIKVNTALLSKPNPPTDIA